MERMQNKHTIIAESMKTSALTSPHAGLRRLAIEFLVFARKGDAETKPYQKALEYVIVEGNEETQQIVNDSIKMLTKMSRE